MLWRLMTVLVALSVALSACGEPEEDATAVLSSDERVSIGGAGEFAIRGLAESEWPVGAADLDGVIGAYDLTPDGAVFERGLTVHLPAPTPGTSSVAALRGFDGLWEAVDLDFDGDRAAGFVSHFSTLVEARPEASVSPGASGFADVVPAAELRATVGVATDLAVTELFLPGQPIGLELIADGFRCVADGTWPIGGSVELELGVPGNPTGRFPMIAEWTCSGTPVPTTVTPLFPPDSIAPADAGSSTTVATPDP